MTSDAGALLLGATDRAVGLVERFAACFSDGRAEERVVRTALTKISALLSLLPNAPGLQYEAVC